METFGLAEIEAASASISENVRTTPLVKLPGDFIAGKGAPTELYAKLELHQHTGTFKARGALLAVRCLTEAQRRIGVVAVSAGNHAIATAFAARLYGVDAKVVMIRSANPYRVQRCRFFGAEVLFADNIHEAFEQADRVQADEGRTLIHPFDSRAMMLGSATLGREIVQQCPWVDLLIVPVGGGGLIAGLANSVKLLRPECKVVGIEPQGANSMTLSMAAGEAVALACVSTIADSLAAPRAMPDSFSVARQFVDDVELVSDDQIRQSMKLICSRLKLAVEPACAASTAGALGPLREMLAGQRVVALFCGSNIDPETFLSLVADKKVSH